MGNIFSASKLVLDTQIMISFVKRAYEVPASDTAILLGLFGHEHLQHLNYCEESLQSYKLTLKKQQQCIAFYSQVKSLTNHQDCSYARRWQASTSGTRNFHPALKIILSP